MRMRRKKYLDERLDACGNVNLGWLVDYAAEQRGETQQRPLDVREIFGNDNPVHLEVGCGKGGLRLKRQGVTRILILLRWRWQET